MLKVNDVQSPVNRRRPSTSRRRLSSMGGASFRERRRSSCVSGMEDDVEPAQNRYSWRGVIGELTYREFLSVSSKSPKSHSECNARHIYKIVFLSLILNCTVYWKTLLMIMESFVKLWHRKL